MAAGCMRRRGTLSIEDGWMVDAAWGGPLQRRVKRGGAAGCGLLRRGAAGSHGLPHSLDHVGQRGHAAGGQL